jgi:AP-3 complex subunit sigma
VLVFNNHGKPRLIKFYEHIGEEQKQQNLIREIFKLLLRRNERMCNFVEGGKLWGADTKIIYRQYATLYFVFWVDESESELGILDLIQVFVETLDKCFESVCELDIIFNVDKVHYILQEVVMGGMVLETEMPRILLAYNEQEELVKKEDRFRAGVEEAWNQIKRKVTASS